LNPTDALRDKFEKAYGVRPRFHQTLVTFKTGGRVFAPKLVKVIYNYALIYTNRDKDKDRDREGKRMKRSVRQKNDHAQQRKNGISFHSIYYRYFSFIFALLILFFYVVGRRQGLETLDVDLSLVQLQLSPREFALYGNGILLLFSIPFYFYGQMKLSLK